MTLCDAVQARLVDETAPAPDGLEAHLLACEACQGFRAAAAAATRLQGLQPRPATRLPLARVRQRAAALGAAALAVVGAAGWWTLEAPRLAPAPPSVEGRLVPDAPSLAELMELEREVSQGARRDPSVHDVSYRAFGPLLTWVALETTPPGRAVKGASSPLVSPP